jgi:hypothetical protein
VSVVADQVRWRHVVVVIAKRIDAGLEKTEHELGFHRESRPRPDSGALPSATPKAEKRPAK